jgi:hypothetical protein
MGQRNSAYPDHCDFGDGGRKTVLMEMNAKQTALPIKEWGMAMQLAANNIYMLGSQLISSHRGSSERANEVCRNWLLVERQADEKVALNDLIRAAGDILNNLDNAMHGLTPQSMQSAADSIERNLPQIEDAFLTVRHCAQDLLHWAQRYGAQGDSSLESEYRASYEELISFAPIFKPRLESFQQVLLEMTTAAEAVAETRRLLSAITSYIGVVNTAHAFVRAVVSPPLDLVFKETEEFLNDLQKLPVRIRTQLASELNDCCQNLLYEPSAFYRTIKPVGYEQPEGIESSLVVFSHNHERVLLSVEDDPIFGQITVHLLRAVPLQEYDESCAAVIEDLQKEWL